MILKMKNPFSKMLLLTVHVVLLLLPEMTSSFGLGSALYSTLHNTERARLSPCKRSLSQSHMALMERVTRLHQLNKRLQHSNALLTEMLCLFKSHLASKYLVPFQQCVNTALTDFERLSPPEFQESAENLKLSVMFVANTLRKCNTSKIY